MNELTPSSSLYTATRSKSSARSVHIWHSVAGAQQHQTSALRVYDVAAKSPSRPPALIHPKTASSTNGVFPKITLPGLFPSIPAGLFVHKPPRALHLAPGSMTSSSLARLRGTALPTQQEHGSLMGAVCSSLQLPILHPPLLSRPPPRRAGHGSPRRAKYGHVAHATPSTSNLNPG